MKKSFTLIEVIISVTILSIIITSVLQIQENNLDYLEKFKNSKKNNEYISIATLYDTKSKDDINTHIYLDKIAKFKDDDIRKELKDIKVYIKKDLIDTVDLSSDDYSLSINTYKENYKINNKVNKNFYTFTLEY